MKFLCLILLFTAAISCGKKTEKSDSKPHDGFGNSPVENQSSRDRLLQGIRNNALPEVLEALQTGANPDTIFTNGSTALTYAIRQRAYAIVDMLIKAGAKLDHGESDGTTPLMLAVTQGDEKLVKNFLQLGANPNLQNAQSETALHLAIQTKQESLGLILVKSKAECHIPDAQGRTPRMLSEEHKLEKLSAFIKIQEELQSLSHEELLLYLITEGDGLTSLVLMENYPKEISQPAKEAALMLVTALDDNEVEPVVRALVKGGPRPKLEVLINAAIKGHAKLIKHLVAEQGMDANGLDKESHSSLIRAIKANKLPSVIVLVELGAHIKYNVNISGRSYKFNGCSTAKDVGATLSNAQDIAANKEIKRVMNCSWWPF